MSTPNDDFEEVMARFDRVLRNEDGIRDTLIEGGILVCVRCAHRPHQAGGCTARYFVDGVTTDPCLCEIERSVSDSGHPQVPNEGVSE